MIQKISHYFESKTGIYLHPRFILSVLGLSIALLIFATAYTVSRVYADSVKTVIPMGADAEQYDVRMRSGSRTPVLEQ